MKAKICIYVDERSKFSGFTISVVNIIFGDISLKFKQKTLKRDVITSKDDRLILMACQNIRGYFIPID